METTRKEPEAPVAKNGKCGARKEATMSSEELKRILENHLHWLNKDCEGWEDMRADLSYAKLSKANLSGAYLRYADLSKADLRYADLSKANLSGANLSKANLSGANLSGAYLRGANLNDADLRYAYLRYADLNDAYLRYADLSKANLRYADLSKANLRYADLRGANLNDADLRGAETDSVKYDETTAFFALQCPEDGSFIAWKKVNGMLIKLEVPADAERSSATTRKCRCSHARVLGIYNCNGELTDIKSVRNNDYCGADYVVGETVCADKWDGDRWNECTHGIHFFITFGEAKKY